MLRYYEKKRPKEIAVVIPLCISDSFLSTLTRLRSLSGNGTNRLKQGK